MNSEMERLVTWTKKLPYAVIPLLIIGACGIWQNDPTIEAEKESHAEAPLADPTAGAGLPASEPQPQDLVNPSADPSPSSCPAGMILVEGKFCPKVEQTCVEWLDDPAKFQFARCKRFSETSECKSAERVSMRFCIDRFEAADDSGMPIGDISWTAAAASCKASGKRLCQEREWLFACEGEEAKPYPYGYVRSPSLCNFEIQEGLATPKGELADHRQPVTANPNCTSPFGVQNMVGNIDEWVVLDHPWYSAVNGNRKMNSGLKGGWWGPLRNRCRPTTVDHDELFHELQTGFRCCSDAT